MFEFTRQELSLLGQEKLFEFMRQELSLLSREKEYVRLGVKN